MAEAKANENSASCFTLDCAGNSKKSGQQRWSFSFPPLLLILSDTQEKGFNEKVHIAENFNIFGKWNFITIELNWTHLSNELLMKEMKVLLPPTTLRCFMIHFAFNSMRHVFFLLRRFRDVWMGGDWRHSVVIMPDEVFLCAAICVLLFLKCLKVMVFPFCSHLSCRLFRSEWQIIWLFIMNCHVSQENYINYPTERRFAVCCSISGLLFGVSIIQHFTSCLSSSSPFVRDSVRDNKNNKWQNIIIREEAETETNQRIPLLIK